MGREVFAQQQLCFKRPKEGPGDRSNSSGYGHFKLPYMNGPFCASFLMNDRAE
jgi:hypothetical protein